MIDLINHNLNHNKKFLIDGGHIFEIYSSSNDITNLQIYNLQNPQFYKRENYNYLKIDSLIQKKYFDYIIIDKSRNYSNQKIDFLNEYYSSNVDFQKYLVFNSDDR